MKTSYVCLAVLLLVGLSNIAQATFPAPIEPEVDYRKSPEGGVQFSAGSFTDLGSQRSSGVQTQTIRPCEWHYWQFQTLSLEVGDYINLQMNASVLVDTVVVSPDDNLELYIQRDALPTEESFLWKNTVATVTPVDGETATGSCFIEIVCDINDAETEYTYWIGVKGPSGSAAVNYRWEANQRKVVGPARLNGVDQGATRFSNPVVDLDLANPSMQVGPTERVWNIFTIDPNQDSVRDYIYFAFDYPADVSQQGAQNQAGAYLTFNISDIATTYEIAMVEQANYLQMFVAYGHLPFNTDITGAVYSQENEAEDSDVNCIDNRCYRRDNTTNPQGYPANNGVGYSCQCRPYMFEGYLTCEVLISPCNMEYGQHWYGAVILPPEDPAPMDPNDIDTESRFTVRVTANNPEKFEMAQNVSYFGSVQSRDDFIQFSQWRHFVFHTDAADITYSANSSYYLWARLTDVTNGRVGLYVHKESGLVGNVRSLAGLPTINEVTDEGGYYDATERCGCYPMDAWCEACSSCNAQVPKCHFVEGATYYLSVRLLEELSDDRLPVTYVLTASVQEEPQPRELVAGVPMTSFVGQRIQDFWRIDVPETADTQLMIEVYTDARDTEIWAMALADYQPGLDCYPEPDYYCRTARDVSAPTSSRQSCTFVIEVCNLQEGPLYVTVFGGVPSGDRDPSGYLNSDLDTYYYEPVYYTIWAAYNTPMALRSGVQYTETVVPDHYNHYYILAENIEQGSYLQVEATNVQNTAGANGFNVFVNYEVLAGDCPCYDNLFNCTHDTGDITCPFGEDCEYPYTAVKQLYPTPRSVESCCRITVTSCHFRPGVWYISVLGKNAASPKEGGESFDVGYVLTATIHGPPQVRPLALETTETYWVEKDEMVHYRLATPSRALRENFDLIVRLVWAQNDCNDDDDVGEQHLSGGLTLRVAHNTLAQRECYDYPFSCTANRGSYSYCYVVIPSCQWLDAQYFLSVDGDPLTSTTAPARYTLQASIENRPAVELRSNLPVHGNLPGDRYQHYWVRYNGDEQRLMHVHLFYNYDQSANAANHGTNQLTSYSFFMNYGERAGGARGCKDCYDYQRRCTDSASCEWFIQPCELQEGVYYFSVYAPKQQFFDEGVDYTLIVEFNQVSTAVADLAPITGVVWPDAASNNFNHYYHVVESLQYSEYMQVRVSDVARGSVVLFVNKEGLAGPCPCYDTVYTDSASGLEECLTTADDFVHITIPPCEMEVGTYFMSVMADEASSANGNQYFAAPIGYTLVVEHFVPKVNSTVATATFDMGSLQFHLRDNWPANTEFLNQELDNHQYAHYRVSIPESARSGFSMLYYNVSRIEDGSVSVYYNIGGGAFAADDYYGCPNNDCGWALCSTPVTGRLDGRCQGFIPPCHVWNNDEIVISVLGHTSRRDFELVRYDIRIFLQDVISTPGSVAHPFGFPRIFRLDNVDATQPRGLLTFFTTDLHDNIGLTANFFANVNPEAPAGAFACNQNNPTVMSGECIGQVCAEVQNELGAFSTSYCLANDFDDDIDEGLNDECNVTVANCVLRASGASTWFVTVLPDATATGQYDTGLEYTWSFGVRQTGSSPVSLETTTRQRTDPPFVLSQEESWAHYVVNVDVQQNPVTGDNGTVTDTSEYKRLEIQMYSDNATPLNFFISTVTEEFFDSEEDFPRQGLFPIVGGNQDGCCGTYYCATGTMGYACNTNDRYVIESCCLSTSKTYISVRQTTASNADHEYSFIVRVVEEPALVIAGAVPGAPAGSLNDDGVPSLEIGLSTASQESSGVEPDNYRHYRISLNADNFANGESLIFNITRAADSASMSPILSVRKGYKAGRSNVMESSNGGYGSSRDCYRAAYTCVVPGSPDDSFCVIDIPNCELEAGDWYVSVYNPGWVEEPPEPNSQEWIDLYVGFELSINYRVEATDAPLTAGTCLNRTQDDPRAGQSGADAQGFYVHFQWEITEADLETGDFSQPGSTSFEKQVRLWLNNVEDALNWNLNRPVLSRWNTLEENLSGQAGELYQSAATSFSVWAADRRNYVDNEYCMSADFSGACVGGGGDCSTVILERCPWQGSTFSVGVYYVSVWLSGSDEYEYDICLTVDDVPFQVMSGPAALTDANELRGDASAQRWTVSEVDIDTADQTTPFWYKFEVSEDEVGDDTVGSYMVFNLTQINSGSTIQLDVWRDDCTHFSCNSAGGDDSCFAPLQTSVGEFAEFNIDGLYLSTCTLKAGRYYVRVSNFADMEDFRLDADLRRPLTNALVLGEWSEAEIFQSQYQQWTFEVPAEAALHSVAYVEVSGVECGQVEVWLNKDRSAGPPLKMPSSQNFDVANDERLGCDRCAISYCRTDTGDDENQCSMVLDTCEVTAGTYYLTVRGVSQAYRLGENSESTVTDEVLLWQHINYQVRATVVSSNLTQSAPSCPATVDFFTPTYECAGDPSQINLPTQQFYVDLETVTYGTSLRFSLVLDESEDENARVWNGASYETVENPRPQYLWVNLNDTVGQVAAKVDLDASVKTCPNSAVITQGSGSASADYQCEITSTSAFSCSFSVDYCDAVPGRYYLWPYAYDGAKVYMERWVPYVPILSPGQSYYSSIGVVSNDDSLFPYRGVSDRHFYRIDTGALLASDFQLTLDFEPVYNGQISVNLFAETEHSRGYNCRSITGGCWFTRSMSVSDEWERMLIQACELTPCWADTLWMTVTHVSTDDCVNCRSASYSFSYELHADADQLQLNSGHCDSVARIETYHHYLLQPASSPVFDDQVQVLEVQVRNVDKWDNPATSTSLYLNDNALAGNVCNDAAWAVSTPACQMGATGWQTYMCAYDDLHLSVRSSGGAATYTDYYIETRSQLYPLTTLSSGVPFVRDAEVCIAEGSVDFYVFTVPAGTDVVNSRIEFVVEGAAVDSFAVNKGSTAQADYCASVGQLGSAGVIYEECHLEVTTYHVTIMASQQYTITATLISDVVPITLGQVTLVQTEVGSQSYLSFEVTESQIADADTYLRVDFMDFGLLHSDEDDTSTSVVAYLQHARLASPRDSSPAATCYDSTAARHVSSNDYGEFTMFVSSCDLEAGTYYLYVTPLTGGCRPVRYNVFPHIVGAGFDPIPLSGSVVNQQISTAIASDVHVYSFSSTIQAFNGVGQVRLANVQNGNVQLAITHDRLGYVNNYYTTNLNGLTSYAPLSSSSCRYATCQTNVDRAVTWDFDQYRTQDEDRHNCGSCALSVESCAWTLDTNSRQWYAVVSALNVFDDRLPVQYDLLVEESEYRDINNQTQAGSFGSDDPQRGNWQYDYFVASTNGVQSLMITLEVTSSGRNDGVWMSVRDNACYEESNFFRNVWCAAHYESWQCQVEIPARADYWKGNQFFVEVYGKQAEFTVRADRGLANCGVVDAADLDFCADIVTYQTWTWAQPQSLDSEARCRADQIQWHFENGDRCEGRCQEGISPQCVSAIQRFSCFESFRQCDRDGFQTGVCTQACDMVVYFCHDWFDNVGLQEYNCTSDRYIDLNEGVCSGMSSRADLLSFASRPLDEQLAAEDTKVLTPITSAANSLVSSVLFVVVALVAMIAA
eukprot:CAMPEP_0177634178 /NCGR_PEP_ID=MMETSP0447-20121125/3231_1 /TAXON_ID=0 /ORGANISM="Stygamoeba regulata, Strain BSH-02190019" /LENGTH=3549 /DNA_ID=CAMNT_0019135885 /DNA_START=153 /DNA_END=10802 /DNA_ORIENTATION=-